MVSDYMSPESLQESTIKYVLRIHVALIYVGLGFVFCAENSLRLSNNTYTLFLLLDTSKSGLKQFTGKFTIIVSKTVLFTNLFHSSKFVTSIGSDTKLSLPYNWKRVL